jgi:hypothetical protein
VASKSWCPHADPEGVEHGPEVHAGEPAPHVGLLREDHPDRHPVLGRRGDEAGQPGEGVGVDEADPVEIDHGDTAVQVEREHVVERDRVQGMAVDRHEREYRASRGARPEPGRIGGYV